jgi:mRNA interferase MazF
MKVFKKDYRVWTPLKIKLNNDLKRPMFKERDVWWVNVGENIGHEEDDKSDAFTRPVLVIKKFNSNMFWGIPLSTTKKSDIYYIPVLLNGKISVALISQLRAFDSSRLSDKLGMISLADFKIVCKKTAGLLPG